MSCPFAFLIKLEMPGTIVSATPSESEYSMELVMCKFGEEGAELNR